MLLLGFAVGVFPVVAWQIIRNIMIKIFRYALPSLESQLALDCLDGLTVWHEARLEEEDIENVPNMATADIVSLLVSTRLPADRIVDWVDQAILLTYLGPDQASNSDCNSARHTAGAPRYSDGQRVVEHGEVNAGSGRIRRVRRGDRGRVWSGGDSLAAVVDPDKQQPLSRLALAWNGRRGARSTRKNQLQIAPGLRSARAHPPMRPRRPGDHRRHRIELPKDHQYESVTGPVSRESSRACC